MKKLATIGAGIAAEMLPNVFDLFAQVDRTLDRAKGGLGIGLPPILNFGSQSLKERIAGPCLMGKKVSFFSFYLSF